MAATLTSAERTKQNIGIKNVNFDNEESLLSLQEILGEKTLS